MQLLPSDEMGEGPDAMAREAVVTLTLCAPLPGQIGLVVDQIEALLREAEMVSATLVIPGYHQTFYGVESDQDDPS